MILFYRIIVLILSLISVISIMLSDVQLPNNLIVLPLLFVCLYFLLPMFSRYMFNNIGITIVNITMLIRYVISPLLMSVYGVNVDIGMSTSIGSQTKAINLMIFEMVVIIITFCILHKRFYSNKNEFREMKAKSNLFGWAFVLFSFVIVLSNPEVLARYTFIWSASQLKSEDVVESVSLFFLIVQLAHIVATIGVLNWIYKFYEYNKKIIWLFLSLIVIGISSSFITGTSRFSIILPLASGLFTIFILYKNYRKLIIILSVGMSLLLIAVSTSLKQNTITSQSNTSIAGSSSTFENFNTDLQLYFSGVSNVAHSIDTSYIYAPFQFDAIIAELLRSVIFINSLFKQDASALTSFNEVFYQRALVFDQILPMIGQGFLYFGPYLAPVLSLISIILVMLLDKKIYKCDSVFKMYIMSYLCVKLSLFFMANATIQMSFFTNFFIILLVISYMNNKFIVKKV